MEGFLFFTSIGIMFFFIYCGAAIYNRSGNGDQKKK